ncbi:MAG: prepilin-type N-terminal cleavage/methylation domain-containing protein [Patescibacteria group bacterium]
MKKHKGFTLIELLVVIAIIGLLSTLAVVALNNARQKSRDARRIADIKQIQTALELYFNDQNGYPVEAAGVTLGAAADATLGSTSGFAAACTGTCYMGKVPAAPTPPTGNVYTYTAPVGGATYTIAYTLEGVTGGVPAGAQVADPEGIY